MDREVILVDESDTDDEIPEIVEIPKPSVEQRRKFPEKALRVQPIVASQTASAIADPPPSTGDLQPTSAESSSVKSPFLLDRAAMERERLARQKRLRGDLNAPASSSSDDETDEGEPDRNGESKKRDAKRRKLGDSLDKPTTTKTPDSSNHAEGKYVHPGQIDTSSKSTDELFLKGEVRPTWNEYAQDKRKRFKIQDVIGDVSRADTPSVVLPELTLRSARRKKI